VYVLRARILYAPQARVLGQGEMIDDPGLLCVCFALKAIAIRRSRTFLVCGEFPGAFLVYSRTFDIPLIVDDRHVS
jgi:hypothetical protein